MISILLSVHNGARDLPKTLESIYGQTDKHWELIVVNDASNDATETLLVAAAKRFPEKVKILTNSTNLGLTKSLIRAAEIAEGEWLARIDNGDTYAPQKLGKQRAFLVQHPEVVLLGCAHVNRSENPRQERTIYPPETDAHIRKTILKRNPFAHSAVLMKKSVYQQAGGYDATVRYAQDYDLWFRMIQHGKAANLSEVLCVRTLEPNSISYQKQNEQMRQCLKIRWQYMNKKNPLHYLCLLEPLGVLLTPVRLKKFFQSFSTVSTR